MKNGTGLRITNNEKPFKNPPGKSHLFLFVYTGVNRRCLNCQNKKYFITFTKNFFKKY